MPIAVDHFPFPFSFILFCYLSSPFLFVKISVVFACLSFSLGRSAPKGRIRHSEINVAVEKKRCTCNPSLLLMYKEPFQRLLHSIHNVRFLREIKDSI
jgi:hypothetical protein